MLFGSRRGPAGGGDSFGLAGDIPIAGSGSGHGRAQKNELRLVSYQAPVSCDSMGLVCHVVVLKQAMLLWGAGGWLSLWCVGLPIALGAAGVRRASGAKGKRLRHGAGLRQSPGDAVLLV